MASLELVLDALINVQSPATWVEFTKEWGPSLRSDSETAYQKYITIYKDRGWPQTEFFQHLTLGCFPLHSLTSYLLCNLDFTQGRTAVQFIKEDVKQFIAREPVDNKGFLNYIYPTKLVDAFHSNLSNHASYSDYARAMSAVTSSADDDDRQVLKALFLFYVSGSKLKKPDSELHNELIGILTGLSSERVKTSLTRLTTDLGIIYHIPKNNTYRFYAGLGLADLKKAIENEIAGIAPSIEEVVKFCQSNADTVLGGNYVEGQRFVSDNRVDKKDWTFEIRACSTQAARQLFSGGVVASKSHGVVAYIVPSSPEDAMSFSAEVTELFSAATHAKGRLVVALPSTDLGGVARTLLLLKTLRAKSAAEREKYGEAYAQLQKLWEQEVLKRLTDAFRTCEFRNPVIQTLAVAYRDDRQEIVSTLLDQLYPFTPPLENVDKLRAGHSTGAQIVTFAVKQLFGNTLSRQNLPNASYATVIDSVLVQRWGLLTQSANRYTVQDPKDRRVQTAWKRLSDIFDLSGEQEKRVSLGQVWREFAASPYGYNELTFVCLLGAWLVRHRQEVALGVRGKKADGSPTSAEVSLSRFVAPEGNFDKTFGKPKEFLAFFTSHETSFIICRKPVLEVAVPENVKYDQAQEFVTRISEYLSQDTFDKLKAVDLQRKKREIEEGVQVLDKWHQPMLAVMNGPLPNTINNLVTLYSDVTKEPEEFESGITVEASQEQRRTQVGAINKITKAVETVIGSYRVTSAAFTSESECNALLNQIDREQEALVRETALATAFAEQLTAIRLSAQRRIEDLLRTRAMRQESEKLQNVVGSLNSNSSESALAAARLAVEDAAAGVPGLNSTIEFRSAIEKLDSYVKTLADGLAAWQSAAGQIRSSKDADRLRQEIEARRERYDSESGGVQCADLINALVSAAERFGRTEELEDNARRHVELASALWRQIKELGDIPSALKLYDDLAERAARVPAPFPKQAADELNRLDELARHEVTTKVQALCVGKVTTMRELDRRAELLSQIRPELLGRGVFAELTRTIDDGIAALSEERERLGQIEQDRQRLQTLRQIRPETITSLASCKETIEEVTQTTAALRDKAALTTADTQILPKLKARAESFVKRLEQVRERLPLSTSLGELVDLQRTYNQLDLVFRGSDLETNYAALDSEFKGVREDLEKLRDLESEAKTVTSVLKARATLDATLAMEGSLHYADRYRGAIQGIASTLKSRLQGYSQALTALEGDLNAAQSTKESERAWEKIVAQRAVFSGSELEGDYSRLLTEAEALLAFMRVRKPLASLISEQDCVAAMDAVTAWQSDGSTSTTTAIQRATAYKGEIVAASEELRTAKRRSGEVWLKSIIDSAERVQIGSGDPQVVLALGNLLERIRAESAEHATLFDSSAVSQLDSVRKRCEDALDSDRESKILFLVSQLPEERQAELCRKLAQLLHLEIGRA